MRIDCWIRLVLERLRQDRSGQDMIEYALITAFLALAAAVLFPNMVAPALTTIFTKVSHRLSEVAG